MAMKSRHLIVLVALGAAGCQTTQSRQSELAAICANPANRQPKSFYFSECQALYPSSARELEKDYAQGAPSGNR
jgi:hypothetical protein